MPPRFFRKAKKKEDSSAPRGQRPITGFLVSSPPPSTSGGAGAAAAAAADTSLPPSKRQKTGQTQALDETSVPGSSASPASAATAVAVPPVAPATRRVPAGNAGPSALSRQALQQKLAAGDAGGSGGGGGGAAGGAAALQMQRERGPIEPEYVTDVTLPFTAAHRAKLTPLEQQLVELKRKHPGVLLVIEVGYKYKFFGQDAVTASRVLGIYSYQDRSFLSAGVPAPRLHVHIRRLVDAGHKVGMVRQVETAAIKKAGDNRAGPFERRLTALYTRATLEAGELGGLVDDDKDEEEEEEAGAREQPPATAAAAAAAADRPSTSGAGAAAARPARRGSRVPQEQSPSSYLVCVVEEPARGSGAGGGTPGSTARGTPGGTASATPGGNGTQSGSAVEIGLVAVDPSTGALMHAQFRDGPMRQELESRLLFASPAELLVAQPASAETRRLCEGIGQQLGGAGVRLEAAPAGKYGEAGGSALSAVLAFYGAGSSGSGKADSGDGEGTSAARSAAAAGAGAAASGTAQPASSAEALAAVRALPALVLRALAHLLDYLRPFGLQAVLRLGASFQPWATAQEMRLSANTLRQLEIFANTSDGGKRGSLLSVLDHTQTAMGRRLLRSWVGKPLRRREAILARLDAVQELAEQGGSHPVLSRLGPALKKLGDMERGITRAFHGTIRPSDFAALLSTFSRLHEALGVEAELAGAAELAPADVAMGDATNGVGGASSESHEGADGGGEADLPGVAALAAAQAPPLRLQGVQSALLRQLLAAAADLRVAAAARQLLASMDLRAAEANDRQSVLKDSERFPEVLRWRGEVASTQRQLGDLLKQYRKQLNISNLEYKSVQNLGEYLLEIPADLVKRVPKDWEKANAIKKGVRFRPPEVKAALQQMELAREHLQAACNAAWRQFLAGFAELYLPFRAAVQALAALDCLHSLSQVASTPGYCRPELLDPSATPPQLHVEGGRHPVVELLLEGQGGQFVPNDTHLQADGRRCMIVTGPNMGGKSCYTRQCALIAIVAQLGSFVPAAAARLTPLDGVFTRMGAADNIALGRSTFAEELGETSAILASASSSSLVILDELGRGTSTGDGSAIAEACLRYIVAGQGPHPLTLFITHYPEVCLRLQSALPGEVTCFRMAHAEEPGAAAAPQQAQQGPQQEAQHVQQEAQQEQEQEEEAGLAGASPALLASATGHVVFLYKLVEGVAPASYGLNVARMAQLPAEVLHRAAQEAARVQAAAEGRRRKGQQEQDGPGTQGAAVPGGVLGLAQQCREFLSGALAGGAVDVERGQQLQRAVRELLGCSGGIDSIQ